MNKFLSIFILSVIIFASGCSSKEYKYTKGVSQNEYITFSSDGTAFYNTGGVENYKGTWKEVDGQYGEKEITVFLDDQSSLVYRVPGGLGAEIIYLKVEADGNNGGVKRYYLDS